MSSTLGRLGDNKMKKITYILTLLICLFSITSADCSDYINKEEIQKEIELLTANILKDSNNPILYLERAKYYQNLCAYKKAIKDYSKVLEINNTNISALYSRALCYRLVKRYEEALKDLEALLKIAPENIRGYIEKYNVIYQMSNFDSDKAIEVLNEAIKIGINKNFTNYNLSYLYSERAGLFSEMREDYFTAIVDLTSAIKYYEHSEYYFHRGMFYYQVGYFRRALADYNKTLKLNEKELETDNHYRLNEYMQDTIYKNIAFCKYVINNKDKFEKEMNLSQ